MLKYSSVVKLLKFNSIFFDYQKGELVHKCFNIIRLVLYICNYNFYCVSFHSLDKESKVDGIMTQVLLLALNFENLGDRPMISNVKVERLIVRNIALGDTVVCLKSDLLKDS